MTTYYVGAGGDNGNAGTSWALRKLTLNGAEDIPVAAGDEVVVGPGTYRELLTVDVSGSAGSPVTYTGDYLGTRTDGVGGVVRITGSDNDQAATRNNCITATAKDYRTFRGFAMDTTIQDIFLATNCQYVTVDECILFERSPSTYGTIRFQGAACNNHLVSNCVIGTSSSDVGVTFAHSGTVDNVSSVVSNCIIHGGGVSTGVNSTRIGGITVKNCYISCVTGVAATLLAAGQTVTVNNCIIDRANQGLVAGAAGMITENYNTLYACVTARLNVSVGANSLAYPPLFDTRWFFEAVNSGRLLSPFDLASYSQLINVAGTSPTTTDLRGTSAIGGQREFGALEYDNTLILPAIGEVIEAGGGTYHEAEVGEVEAGVTFGPASGYTGTLAVGGGGGVPVIGGNVVRR